MNRESTRGRRPPRGDGALARQWGVAECEACGDTLVLGEVGARRGSHPVLCVQCQSAPRPVLVSLPARTGFRVLGHAPGQQSSERLSDAA